MAVVATHDALQSIVHGLALARQVAEQFFAVVLCQARERLVDLFVEFVEVD